ncbi:MAG TPA: DoxX family protein [Sphingomicrobium sp.]|nr:DoxX family protein [Sphingomicrobium sp.]HWJ58723.1 DoxX family protein [Sphingomicrobium sp.]
MEFAWLSRWQPQLLAILRIVTGLLLVEHGTMKFFHFPAPLMPGPLPPLLVAAGAIELVTGVLVTVGLFTRLAAFIASGELAFAYFIGHFPKSFWPGINMGETAILFCFVFLYLAAAGPGAWSVDAARMRNASIR